MSRGDVVVVMLAAAAALLIQLSTPLPPPELTQAPSSVSATATLGRFSYERSSRSQVPPSFSPSVAPTPTVSPTPEPTPSTTPHVVRKFSASTPHEVLTHGWATWYRWHRGEAAAGPALRRALGKGWRGTIVRVCIAKRCTKVRLTDWCACGPRRGTPTVIDLDRRSFIQLAPASKGVIRVTVTLE